MKTIGEILRRARANKKLTLEQVEKITKIRKSFIQNIELEKWELLPAYPTILGFVKSIASALDLDPNAASAVFKRDYPPKKLTIVPKPDLNTKNKTVLGPRLVFLAGVGIFLSLILGYLGFQYRKFVSPPYLKVESPKDGQIVMGQDILVFGKTDRDAKVTVNNQAALVNLEGGFSVTIGVVKSTEEIIIKAESRSGKSSTVIRKIKVN